MIRVIKRDNAVEPLCADRLRLCLWRAMQPHGGQFHRAHHISRAIVVYLHRKGLGTVTSRALFEMAVRALRKTNHTAAADTLEAHRRWRHDARGRLSIIEDTGRRRSWDRNWLTQQLQRRWAVTRNAARAITADIETELLGTREEISYDLALDLVDERVENFGLAPWCLLASAPIQ